MLQKVVYPYVYMDDWGKFNETPLHGKEDFQSYLLNMEGITDTDYMHIKRTL